MIKNFDFLIPFLAFIKKHENKLLIFIFIAYCILTITGISVHEPWRDEAQAWLIAKDLNFVEILNHMKYEGHLFLWYVLLMPFAKNNIPYPMPMLILNMLFIWGAIIIFLKKAPLPLWAKSLVLFTNPFCYQYAIIGRCYSIGILLLFALTALYKNKLKHPIIYSLLLILSANTSVLALFGTTAFGILFIYDYIKTHSNKLINKTIILPSLILVLGAVFVIYQIFGCRNATLYFLQYGNIYEYMYNGLLALRTSNPYITKLVINLYIFFIPFTLFKRKDILFFFMFTLTMLNILFLKYYAGGMQHYYFFYVYFVITFWLYKENPKTKNIKLEKGLTLMFAFMTLCLIVNSYTYYKYDIKKHFSNSEFIALKIKHDAELQKGNIIICDGISHSVIPYLNNYKIPVYSCFSHKQASFFNQSYNILHPFDPGNFTPEKIKFFEDKPIYLIATYKKRDLSDIKSDYYKLKPYYCPGSAIFDHKGLCIFKVEPNYK